MIKTRKYQIATVKYFAIILGFDIVYLYFLSMSHMGLLIVTVFLINVSHNIVRGK